MQGISAGGQGGQLTRGGTQSVTCFTRIFIGLLPPPVGIKLSHKLLQLPPVLTPSCGDVIRISAAAAARGAGWAVDERREGTLVGYLLYPPELNSRHQTFSQAAAITTSGDSLLSWVGTRISAAGSLSSSVTCFTPTEPCAT